MNRWTNRIFSYSFLKAIKKKKSSWSFSKNLRIRLDYFESRTRGERIERNLRRRESLSIDRSMHHALPPPSAMNQFENFPVQSDQARSSGHTHSLWCTLDRLLSRLLPPSIENISAAKESASQAPFISTKLFDRER